MYIVYVPSPDAFADRVDITRLFAMFLSIELREAIVGDLQERYGQTIKQRGRNIGALWFWRQITTSFAHLTSAALKRISGLEVVLRRIGR